MKVKCNSEFCKYCSRCAITQCTERKSESELERKCDGDCFNCDGAIDHISSVPSCVQDAHKKVLACNMYHVQIHHDIECVGNIHPEKLGESKIEKVLKNLSICKDCQMSDLCIEISRKSDFSIEDLKQHLGINWNCANEVILESIPKEKLYAFSSCDRIREIIKDIRIKDLQDYMKTIK